MTDYEPGMRTALSLAARGRGHVEPNPMVGAVVLDAAGTLVGEGWHQKYGGPHAEVHAFQVAGGRAAGGTLIVTLEPCCHWGKTPPCTDAVIRSGVRRVVVAMADPFPTVAGGGLTILRAAGLEVQVGLLEDEARRLNAPYLKLIGTGKPWVHLKWAMTLDGKIATPTGDSKWISGGASRQRVHELRGRMDAVIVGRGTVWADDPLLTARPAGPRTAARVVVSSTGNLPAKCQLLETAGEHPVIVYTKDSNVGTLSAWAAAGAEVVGMSCREGGLGPEDILRDLGRRRYTNVLVEGGAGLHGSFTDSKQADEFHVFVAPKLIGGARAPGPVGGSGIMRLADAIALADLSLEQTGVDFYLHGFAAPVTRTGDRS